MTNEELKEILKEKLDISIDISSVPYGGGYSEIEVVISFDGTEIAKSSCEHLLGKEVDEHEW